MRTLSLVRPLDVHYKGRDISLDMSGELDGHISSRRPIRRGAEDFWLVSYGFKAGLHSKQPDRSRRNVSYYGHSGGAGNQARPLSRQAELSGIRRPGGKRRGSSGPAAGSSEHVSGTARRSSSAHPKKAISGGQRRCLVKITYSDRSGPDIARSNAAKVAYISREEAAIRPKPYYEEAVRDQAVYTYNSKGEKVFIRNERVIDRLGDKPVFRIILSPEDSNVDLSELACRFMKDSFFPAIGSSTPLWFAANHYNTEHPHVHILVSRVPMEKGARAGRNGYLRFSKDYVRKQKAFRDAGRILTDFMGERSVEEAMEISRKLVENRSYSYIDHQIHLLSHREGDRCSITFEDMRKRDKEMRNILRRRLTYLGRHSGGRVRYDSAIHGWWLDKDWDAELQKHLKMERAGIDMDDADKVVMEGKGDDFVPYSGRIVSHRISDEDPDSYIFSIVDEKGKLHVLEDEIPAELDRSAIDGQFAKVGFLKDGKVPKLLTWQNLRKKARD